MTVTVLLDLQLKPEAAEDGLRVLSRALVDTRAFDGCLEVTVLRDQADPAHLIAVERWQSAEHDAAYRRWRAGDGAIVDLPPLLAGAPRTSVCDALPDA